MEAENAYQRALKGYEVALGVHDKRTREVLAAFLDLGIAPHRTLGRRPNQEVAADVDEAETNSISEQHVEAIDNKVQPFPKIVDEVIRKELRGS